MDPRHLRVRQLRLQARSGQLRAGLAEQLRAFHAPLGLADRALLVYDWLRANPLVPLGAVALWLLLRPLKSLHWSSRWTARLWWAWRTVREVRRWLG